MRETAGGEGASLHPSQVPGPPGPSTASRDTVMLGEVISSRGKEIFILILHWSLYTGNVS